MIKKGVFSFMDIDVSHEKKQPPRKLLTDVGWVPAQHQRQWPAMSKYLNRHTPSSPAQCQWNTRHWANAGLMLARRLRRRPNINPALVQCLMSDGRCQSCSLHHECLMGRAFARTDLCWHTEPALSPLGHTLHPARFESLFITSASNRPVGRLACPAVINP